MMIAVPMLLAAAAAGPVHQRFDAALSKQLVPLLSEVIRFPTVAGNEKARSDEQAWLRKTAASLGLVAREAGLVTEIELPGPQGAPVLGLIVHGDVQPVNEALWLLPPFEGAVKDGEVLGRGAADDKGPLVQALLAMAALKESGAPLTQTVRLLVGSDEEGANLDMKTYLAAHEAPAYSLVLDSAFPVIVGEKAWQALTVTVPADDKPRDAALPYSIQSLEAGLAASIVPDRAKLVLHWNKGTEDWAEFVHAVRARPLGRDLKLDITREGKDLTLLARGRAAHAGVNLEGGRNALVALAGAVDGLLPKCGASDLLAFAKVAGVDTQGTGFGLAESTPGWGRYAVNVATIGTTSTIVPEHDGKPSLTINLRRPPPLTGPQLRERLTRFVADFDQRTGARLIAGGFFDDEPLSFDPEGKLVRRLTAAYQRATGRKDAPGISGGGTYAKRVPRAIAFGMWFPGKPYPGHDVDEHNPIADLQLGTHALIEALVDLATQPPLREPFKP